MTDPNRPWKSITVETLRRPTAWQRICQDEPLDPIPSTYDVKEVDAYEEAGCAVIKDSSSGHVTITFPAGVYTFNSGDTLSLTGMSAGTNGLYRISTPVIAMDSLSRIVRATYQYRDDEAPVDARRDTPSPRNGYERKILRSIGTRLGAEITRAERVIGRNDGSSEWNHRFFEFVSRKKPAPSHANEGRHPRGSR